MPNSQSIIGWDIGGAHLKAACLSGAGKVEWVMQQPCPVWQGLPLLEQAMATIKQRILGGQSLHVLTMTAELVDLFPDRPTGVQRLLDVAARQLQPAPLLVYAGRAGFVHPLQVADYLADIASANWHATARFLAGQVERGILVDIGSTTTDLIPFAGGQVLAQGRDDRERLMKGELVYTGVVRTPVMAVTDRVPFDGEWTTLAAEYFATMADVYRLTGELPAHADQMPTADQQGKSVAESATRLARMLGCDAQEASLAAWQRCAQYLAGQQVGRIEQALARLMSRRQMEPGAPLVGAGVGRFLAEKIARRLELQYVDFAQYLEGSAAAGEWTAGCAPAVALTKLAEKHWQSLLLGG